jgi:DnaK suppressor protein
MRLCMMVDLAGKALPRYEPVTILSRLSRGPMSTTSAAASKSLTKKELAVENMALDTNDLPDEMDLASSEYLQSFEFRLRGREKSLLSKLDLALKKIDDGSFGVCEVCEEPIGKKRLEARPETTLCIKCKEDQEREERTMG